MMCKLKERMDNGGHYDVEMKGWTDKGAILCANYKRWEGRWERWEKG